MTQDATARIIAALFDAKVAVSVTDPRDPQPALVGDEAAHVANAIHKRQREFAAGRAATRAAMAQLGGAPCAIPAAIDRAPIWPAGWQGSISHKNTLCAAVVTQDAMSVGLDLEEATELDEDLIPSICSEMEIMQIEGSEKRRLAKLMFSAKEAAYKAQYPISNMLFGFHHLHLSLEPDSHNFTATFLKPAGPFAIGARVLGRYTQVAGHFVTAVSIPLQHDHRKLI